MLSQCHCLQFAELIGLSSNVPRKIVFYGNALSRIPIIVALAEAATDAAVPIANHASNSTVGVGLKKVRVCDNLSWG